MDFARDFQQGFDRHVRALGFVPPEFQRVQRFGLDDPPEFVLPVSANQRKAFPPGNELTAIEDAAILAHRQSITHAEAARERGGYGGLGPDVKVPDQRPLLQGGDNNPLD